MDKLEELRQLVVSVIPNATEVKRYGIPTFQINGKNIVHIAAFKNHLGFYPGPEPLAHFAEDLKDYKTSKGALQLPLDKPLPRTLLTKIIEHAKKRA